MARYILSINGSQLDDPARLKKVKKLYQEGDVVLLNKFDQSLVDEIFGRDYNVFNIPEGTHDTLHSALIMKSYIQNPDEILLVTSNYHLKRSKTIFEKVLGKEVQAIPAEINVPSYFYVMERLQELLARFVLAYRPSKEEYERLLEVKGPIFRLARSVLNSL